MQVIVRIPTPLRQLVAGARTVSIDVGGDQVHRAGDELPVGMITVGSVLDVLAVEHPALERRLRDEQGQTRAHVNLFVGPDNVRDLEGLRTPITAGGELSIIPAISGG